MQLRARILVLLCLLVAIPVFAQVDKGAIEAVALDQSKAPLPRVTVTVTRPETRFTTVVATDASAAARAHALQHAMYNLQSALDGFAPVNERAISILAGRAPKLTGL